MIQLVSGDPNRDEKCVTTLRSGDFAYEVIADFPKYPVADWEFITVSSGCCDSNDVVYVLMRDARHQIVKLDSDGNYLGEINSGLVSTPHFCCITPDDHLLVMDLMSHCAVEMTKEGELVREIGVRGKASDTGADLLRWRRDRRHGKMIPTEVEEAYSNEKWEFYETLRTIRRVGPPFNRPTSCVCNSKGEYIFGDGYGNCAVHRFSPGGELLSTWGAPAFGEDGAYCPGPGKFALVHGVAVDSKDRVWANDRESDAINVFNPDGSVAAYLAGNLGQPSDLWYDGKYMYAAGRGGYLTIFDDDFQIVAQLGHFNGDLRAHGMCGNSKGDLFLFPTHANPDHQVIKLKRIR